ncbi:Uma2 family endonuclease [Microcoleus sp. ARI1-B5]|uniref:Uma2 family endonuclease n=1 Tax=unclassified Microcoleus TaxID=2642155 RepID=UPI002FD16E49
MTASISKLIQTDITATASQGQTATWEDYLAYRDAQNDDNIGLFFNGDRLLVIDMGKEGINHASINNLFTMLFAFWFSQTPGLIFTSLGGCLLEKPKKQAASPDLMLYLGSEYPTWQTGERRYINLEQWRVPDLVGEISDTTLTIDLDEKKYLYADLGIPEYWVIDVKGLRVFAFRLQSNGKYQECETSLALSGLPISLLNQTLERLNAETNGSAAIWFAQQIASLKTE